MNNQHQDVAEGKAGRIIFWIVWSLLLLVVPIYIFTFFFEASAVKNGQILSYFSPVIGLLVIIAQITVFVISSKQMKQHLPLSKPFLTLIGMSIVIAFVWAGGCAIMGPFRLAG